MRSGVMGFGRHPLHIDAQPLLLGDGFRLLLAVVLGLPLVGREAAHGRRRGRLGVGGER